MECAEAKRAKLLRTLQTMSLGLDSATFNSETQNNKSRKNNLELMWQLGGHQEPWLLSLTTLLSLAYLPMVPDGCLDELWLCYPHPHSRKKEEEHGPFSFTETSWKSFISHPVNYIDQNLGMNSWKGGWER